MSGIRRQTSSAIAAAALAVITIFVFWVLQDYGPESAIRRFHDAVLNRDPVALAQVTAEALNDPNVVHLEQNVVQLAQAGANYRILRMDRGPRRVAAEVQYSLPDGRTGTTMWVVVKQNRVWRVEASETGQYFRRTLGL